MNTYTVQILQILLAYEGKVKLSKILHQLCITRRMFLYYQKQLNEYLSLCHLPNIMIEDESLHMQINKNVDIIKSLMDEVSLEHYILNASERQDCILMKIGICKEPILLEDLIQYFKVSRNTMLSDIAELKKMIKQHHIQLLSKSKQGYYFDGDELNIRYIIMKAYHRYDNLYMESIKKKILLEELQNVTNINDNVIEQVQEILLSSERFTNENFIFFALHDLSVTILLMYLRGYKCKVRLSLDDLLDKNKTVLNFVIVELGNLGIVIDEPQKEYLLLILQAAKVSSLDRLEYEADVITLAKKIITEFESLSQLNLFYQKELADMFLLHVKSMYYRTKYRIKISTFQKVEIPENQGFYYIAKKVMENVGQQFDLLVDEDEIYFLSYYFTCLEKNYYSDLDVKKENIVIVCVSGLGSSVYLRHQLSKLFGNAFVISISDLNTMQDKLNEHTVCIITTIDLDLKSCRDKEIKRVETVLTQENKRDLLEWFLKDNMKRKENMVLNDVFDIIKSYTIIQNQEKLFQHLNQYFLPEFSNQKELQLKDILKESYIRIYNTADTWQQMIYLAGEPLLLEHIIEDSYLQDILGILSEYGLYCEIMNGILVAHANPKNNVKYPALSLAVFHQPLHIEKWNKEITCIFVLGVVDRESHGTAFAQLIFNLSQHNLYQNLHRYSTTKEIYQALIDGV